LLTFREEEQRFCLFFWKKSVDELYFWGQPQTPWFRFAEGLTTMSFLNNIYLFVLWHSAKRNNAFCFFFWKKKTIDELYFWGQPRGSASRKA
jgi:hypothetical protein